MADAGSGAQVNASRTNQAISRAFGRAIAKNL